MALRYKLLFKIPARKISRRVQFILISLICMIFYMEFLWSTNKLSYNSFLLSKNSLSKMTFNYVNSSSMWLLKDGEVVKVFRKLSDDANKTSCPLLDFLASVDSSVRTWSSDAICDELAEDTDILCRIYLRQLGLNAILERQSCALKDKSRVPKFVYFVTFGVYKFQIWNYIALVAAQRHIRPDALYVIGDQHPQGPWWELVIRDIPGLRFVYREAPMVISENKILFPAHKSDIVRLQVLYMNGGVYLDVDMVVLRDIDSILDHDISLGMLNFLTGMGNAFICAKRHSTFVRDWYSGYRSFNNTKWAVNSMQVSRDLYFNNKSRVNLITDQLYRPQFWELPLLLNESAFFDWSRNYAMHIWTAHGALPKTLQEIQTGNSTVHQVFRYILYGDPKPISGPPEIPHLLQ